MSCPEPPVILFGTYTKTGTTYGSQVVYHCDDCFTLIGDDTNTCGENGLWVGSPPSCDCMLL